jgi:ABC-type phosphate transport system auxiliary subunit
MDEQHPDDLVQIRLRETMDAIKAARPTERSELARRYAILITELEKLQAYHDVYIVRRDYWPIE